MPEIFTIKASNLIFIPPKKFQTASGKIHLNPLLARMFFWIGYVEEVGTGTNRIINWCKEWELPEPEFDYKSSSIVVTIRKDVITEEYLGNLGLNGRQIKAVMYVKEKGKITNKEYKVIFNVSKATATRDLSDLVERGILAITGRGKRDMYYFLLSQK